MGKDSQNCSAQGLARSCCITLAVSWRPVNRAHSRGVRPRPESRAWMFPPGGEMGVREAAGAVVRRRVVCLPASMSALTHGARPCTAAFISAVKPQQFLRSTSRPGK